MKKFGLLSTALVLLVCFALSPTFACETFIPLSPLPMGTPALTNEGFIPKEATPHFFWSKDEEKGEWLYVDQEIFINIKKFDEHIQDNHRLIWYETEIKVSNDRHFETKYPNPERIGKTYMQADELATRENMVLGISDDFFALRKYTKSIPGIILHDGKIVENRTYSKVSKSWPTLDLMARFADGSMKTYVASSIDAETLLAQGATDTWAFGPSLISQGKLTNHFMNTSIAKYVNPRQAMGMIAPNHYLIITVEGTKGGSKGAKLDWLAERMLALGCVEALNLDGGNSVKLTFMGEVLNLDRNGKKTNGRAMFSMMALGTHPLDEVTKDVQNSTIQSLLPKHYDEAIALMQAEKYQEAESAFLHLGTYQDSETLATKCGNIWKSSVYDEAYTLYTSKDYHGAKTKFETLGNYSKSIYYLKKCTTAIDAEKYALAKQYQKEGKLVEAKQLYEGMNYKDSHTLALQCEKTLLAQAKAVQAKEAYESAETLVQNGELAKARQAYITAGSYQDTTKQIIDLTIALRKEALYIKAIEAFKMQEYRRAHFLFTQLGETKDSPSMAEKALVSHQEALYQEARTWEITCREEAYLRYVFLSDYMDSASKAKEMLETPLDEATLNVLIETYSELARYDYLSILYTALGDTKNAERMADNQTKLDSMHHAFFLREAGYEQEANVIFKELSTFHDAKSYVLPLTLAITSKDFQSFEVTPKSPVFTTPDGKNHQYQLFEGPATWLAAKTFCELLDGHLVSITSQEENAYIHQFIQRYDRRSGYLGLFYADGTGEWQWVTGEPVAYLNWHPSEPSGASNERYAMFYHKFTDGTWNDSHFYEDVKKQQRPKCAFICEWDVE